MLAVNSLRNLLQSASRVVGQRVRHWGRIVALTGKWKQNSYEWTR